MNSRAAERRIERPRNVEAFEDFDFSSITWNEVNSEVPTLGEKRYIFSRDVVINDEPFQFSALCIDSFSETKYRFRIVKDGRVQMYSELTVTKKEGTDVVKEFVERQDIEVYNNPVLPKNFTAGFFKKLIAFVPNVKSDKRLLHIVQIAPRDGNRDKWDQTFKPTLVEQGYTNERGEWVKEY